MEIKKMMMMPFDNDDDDVFDVDVDIDVDDEQLCQEQKRLFNGGKYSLENNKQTF